MSQYEKKKLAAYNKALKAKQAEVAAAAAAAPKASPAAAPEAPKASSPAAAAALKAVATAKYPAGKVEALLAKDPKALSQYEKKKVAAYNKALKAQAGASPATAGVTAKSTTPSGSKPSTGIAGQSTLSASEQEQVYSKLAKKHGLLPETVKKLASGEYTAKYHQKGAVSDLYAELGVAPSSGTNTSAPKSGPPHISGPLAPGAVNGAHLHGKINSPNESPWSVAPKATLTPGEAAAIRNYTGSAYSIINSNLRQGGAPSTSDLQRDSAISKHSLVTDAKFVRGIKPAGVSKIFGDEIKVGSVVEDKGYGSVTRSTGVASGFAARSGMPPGALVVITAKKGSKAMPVHDVSQFGRGEDEFLLPRGSQFKVTAVDKSTGTIYVDLL